jgi:hypothetical protein
MRYPKRIRASRIRQLRMRDDAERLRASAYVLESASTSEISGPRTAAEALRPKISLTSP